MLGIQQFVVNKSKELSTKLDLSASASGSSASATSVSSSSRDRSASSSGHLQDAKSRNEGELFLREQTQLYQKVLTGHHELLNTGEQLTTQLSRTRKKYLDQVESEHYVIQNFHLIKQVREKMSHLRFLVQKIADEIEDVEMLFMQKTEEDLAAQNASFVARQQQELEQFEKKVIAQKEQRRMDLIQERRDILTRAFEQDLKTYQSLVSYQSASVSLSSDVATQKTSADGVFETNSSRIGSEIKRENETLESLDLVVSTDDASLEAFYEESSGSEEQDNNRLDDKQEKQQEREEEESKQGKQAVVVEQEEETKEDKREVEEEEEEVETKETSG